MVLQLAQEVPSRLAVLCFRGEEKEKIDIFNLCFESFNRVHFKLMRLGVQNQIAVIRIKSRPNLDLYDDN